MQPVYVAKLFELLEFLGIKQMDIVKAFGAAKTQVSLWAHGKRPVPKALVRPLLTMVLRALDQVQAEAEEAQRQPAVTTGKRQTILGAPIPAALDRELQVRSYVEEWAWELADRSGELTRRAQSGGRIVGEVAHRDLNKASNEDLDRYLWALKEVRAAIRYVSRQRKIQLISDDARHDGMIFPDVSKTLVERYKELCRWYGVDLDQAETGTPER
jgi:hypothetical protein